MICVNASNIDKDFDWMKSHISGFDAKIDDQSDSFSLLAIQGPKSESVLNDSFDLSGLEYYGVKEIQNSGGRVIIARTGYTGEDGFEVFGPHDFIIDLWTRLMAKEGVSPCGLGARDVLRLEVCYPLYGHELDDTVTPLDCGLKWCTKLDTGDFIGKESLQNYKTRFQTVKLVMSKGIAREHYKVLDQNQDEIGYITSGTMSVSNSQGIALARINKEKVNTTTDFYVNIRNKNYEATRIKKAFVAGGHK
jgi:aminomethyltransferase